MGYEYFKTLIKYYEILSHKLNQIVLLLREYESAFTLYLLHEQSHFRL